MKKTWVWVLGVAAVLTACSGKTFKTAPSAPSAPVPTNTPTFTATGTSTRTPTASPTETFTPTVTATPTATLPDFNLSGAVTTLNTGTYNFNCVHLSAGAVVTINGGVTIFCQCFTLDAGATITGVGMGYGEWAGPGGGTSASGSSFTARSGGGHGGAGGTDHDLNCLIAPGGLANDDPIHPVEMGSGGVNPTGVPGFNYSWGGGLIKIVVFNPIPGVLNPATLNGTIDMGGQIGCVGCLGTACGSGGAGGTILIEASNIAGNGVMAANGGYGPGGGGGGGGIISFIGISNSFVGTLSVHDGPSVGHGTNGCSAPDPTAQPGIVTFNPAPATGY